jgi:hypothetical protein
MDRELVRTCSAAEAVVLAGAAGRWARVGSARVCVREPSPTGTIDPTGPTRRYRVRVEIAGPGADPGSPAPADAARVLQTLFGDYFA